MYLHLLLTYIHVDIIITDLRPMTLALALFSAMLRGGHCSRHQRRRSKVSGSRSDDGGGARGSDLFVTIRGKTLRTNMCRAHTAGTTPDMSLLTIC